MEQTIFLNEEWKRMIAASEQGYPREVCGLFFGKPEEQTENSLTVCRVEILQNMLEPKHEARLKKLIELGLVSLPAERMARGGAFEFLIDPHEHAQKIWQAQKENLDHIGLFHSHPDHPAEPSATDSSQPMLAGWCNVIVSIQQGKFEDARAWFRKTEQEPFQEQKIFVI